MSDAADLAPYAALRRIAERELELAAEGRYNEIAQLAGQREQVMRMLPQTPPPAAREMLERALTVQRRVTVELMRRREQVLLSLRRVERGTRAARGYRGSIAPMRGERLRVKA
jgi:hypothetical protein